MAGRKAAIKSRQLSLVLPKAALLPNAVDTKAASELLTVPLKSGSTPNNVKNQPQPGQTPTQIKTPAAASAQPQTIIPLSAPVQQRILPLVLPQLTNAVSGTVLSLNDLKQLPLPDRHQTATGRPTVSAATQPPRPVTAQSYPRTKNHSD